MRAGWIVGIDVGGTFTDAIAMHRDGRLARREGRLDARRSVGGARRGARGARWSRGRRARRRHARLPRHDRRHERADHRPHRARRAARDRRLPRLDGVPERHATRPVRPAAAAPERARRHETIGSRCAERLSGLGEVVEPLTDAEVDRVVDEVVRRDPEAVAVAFLFSYLRDDHERRVADAVRAALPDVPVTASSEIAREFREYPRTATAVVNAGLRPLVGRYLEEPPRASRRSGIDGAVPRDAVQRRLRARRARARARRIASCSPDRPRASRARSRSPSGTGSTA